MTVMFDFTKGTATIVSGPRQNADLARVVREIAEAQATTAK
jgi:hypothetical protein